MIVCVRVAVGVSDSLELEDDEDDALEELLELGEEDGELLSV